MVPDILSRRRERVSAKKGGAAARFRPKLGTVSANGPQLARFARSNTASRLHAETVPSFPPAESASNGTGGEAGPMLNLYHAWSASFIFDVNVSHTQVQAHIETTASPFMPRKSLCRRFAAPLWFCTFSCRSGPT